MRILEGIDYEAIRTNPRPIVGYSDVTALHQAVATEAGVGTFHGPMLNLDFHDTLSAPVDAWFWQLLRGEAPIEWGFGEEEVLNHGAAEGILFGGCLSLTAALAGTPFDYWVDDGVWFWEDVAEPTYRIDRMLTHLRLSGRLSRVRAVLIGRLKDCGRERPEELEMLISQFFGALAIPVVRNLPFGHYGDNLLLPISSPVRVDTRQGTLTIPEPAVAPRVR
jgi:muramoyltetrapeptide carboxypeptidase